MPGSEDAEVERVQHNLQDQTRLDEGTSQTDVAAAVVVDVAQADRDEDSDEPVQEDEDLRCAPGIERGSPGDVVEGAAEDEVVCCCCDGAV